MCVHFRSFLYAGFAPSWLHVFLLGNRLYFYLVTGCVPPCTPVVFLRGNRLFLVNRLCSFFSTYCVPLFTDCVPFKIVTNKYKKKSFRGLLKLQSSGDVEGSVKLMQTALELDEKCEFAYETLGTIGKVGFVEIPVLKL